MEAQLAIIRLVAFVDKDDIPLQAVSTESEVEAVFEVVVPDSLGLSGGDKLEDHAVE